MRRAWLIQALGALGTMALAPTMARPAPTGVDAAGAPPLKVVASFSILADMLREVGGPVVDVHSLVPASGDAHVYNPTPADAQHVARAQLLVVNGLRYEGWMERLVKAAGYTGPVVVATRGVKPRVAPGGADPHAWQSLVHARVYVDNIRAALVTARPMQADGINRRAADYDERLAALERSTRARFEQVPAERRHVITGHDAFGYFADAYGIRFVAPQGWSTDSEPSAQAVARIVRQLREHRAGALLAENLSDPRLLERIAREAGVRVGGRLYADALSPPGTEADTYLRLFACNVNTLLGAMAAPGTVPARL